MKLTLKQLFAGLTAVGIVLALAFTVALIQVSRTQADLVQANEARYHAYLLADELRQSSDDLTRFVRTYVVTADPRYERMYMDVLDIRAGKMPRPQLYNRIYWDYVAAGTKPRADGEAIALTDLMKRAGFTEQEFGKLKEAQDNSNALVKTEVIAMNAVKGQFDDGSGQFVRKGAPDLELARNLVHSAAYHQYKATIMKPLDEFLALLDDRTRAAVEKATLANRQAYLLTVALLALALVVVAAALLFTYRRISGQLGAEPAEAQAVANSIAQGDLSVAIHVGRGDQGSLMAAMKAMRDSLATIVGEVRAGTDTVALAAKQLTASNRDLSSRTEEQASSLEETAASMEEMTSTLRQSAGNATQASQLAASASEVATRGGAVMAQVVETMGSINESSRRIVDIISVIDGIAFQTNILALNAAVEAARAGEQGRGFAVVASEVRSLAQRSADAAKEIKTLIGQSVERVESGSRLVNDAGTTINEVVASFGRVAHIIDEISAASSEQQAGVQQVSQAMVQLDQGTQQNAAMVEEAAAAADSLHSQATRLSEVVAVFRLGTAAGGEGSAAGHQAGPAASRVERSDRAVVTHAGSGAHRPALLRPAVAGGQGDWPTF